MSIRDSQGKLCFKKRRRAKSTEYDTIYLHKKLKNDERPAGVTLSNRPRTRPIDQKQGKTYDRERTT